MRPCLKTIKKKKSELCFVSFQLVSSVILALHHMHSENACVFYLSQTYQWATLPLTPCVTLGESLELIKASLLVSLQRVAEFTNSKSKGNDKPGKVFPNAIHTHKLSYLFFGVNIWGLLSGTPILDIFTICEFVTHVLGKDSWHL